MTIAAGFRCRNGVIFGADTDETIGDMKRRVYKIPEMQEPFCYAMITGACDDGHVMDAAVERVFDSIRETKPPDYKSLGKLIRSVLITFYREDIKVYPDTSTGVHLLIAARLPQEKYVEAWSARSGIVRRMHDREVIGMGELMQYVLDHLYQHGMPLDDGALTMVQLLAIAKKRVNFVGGDSYLTVLTDTGALSGQNAGFSVEHEELYEFFHSQARQLLLATGNKRLTDQEYDTVFQQFGINLRWYRQKLIADSSSGFRARLVELATPSVSQTSGQGQ